MFERQEHRTDKYGAWKLQPRRPFLILGNSNLSRIPEISDKRVQVVSYPGAQLTHAQRILKHKTPNSPEVLKVILSFGMNDRNHTLMAVLQRTFSRMLGAAKDISKCCDYGTYWKGKSYEGTK